MNFAHLVGFQTILRKEVIRIVRIWSQTLLPPVINVTLYLLIFGNFIGSRIGSFGEISYVQFIIPGLVMMSVITNAYGNVSSSFFSAKFQRNIEEILVSPLPDYLVIAGYTAGGVFRGMLVAVFVFLVTFLFTSIPVHSYAIILVILFLSAVLFSLAGLLNAMFARKFDDIGFIPVFILSPLTYLGGVFYTTDILPEFWRTVSRFNPVYHMVGAFRYGFTGKTDINVGATIAFLLFTVILLYIICLHYLKKGFGIRT